MSLFIPLVLERNVQAIIHHAQLCQPFWTTKCFEVIPGVLGRSVNFNKTQRFLLRLPMFPDYPFLVTMVKYIKKKKNCEMPKYKFGEKLLSAYPYFT